MGTAYEDLHGLMCLRVYLSQRKYFE